MYYIGHSVHCYNRRPGKSLLRMIYSGSSLMVGSDVSRSWNQMLTLHLHSESSKRQALVHSYLSSFYEVCDFRSQNDATHVYSLSSLLN